MSSPPPERSGRATASPGAAGLTRGLDAPANEAGRDPAADDVRRLRAQLRDLTAILEQATVGFARTDLDGRFVLVNDRYCAIVGRTREELLALRMQDITHPEDLPANLRLFARAIEHREPFVIEKRYVRPDGSAVWVSNSVTAIRDAHGAPEGVLAVSHDITERRRAAAALAAGEERFRRIFQTADVSIWEEDFSAVKVAVDALRREGVTDIRAWLAAHPEFVERAVSLVRVVDVNDATLAMFGARDREELLQSLGRVFVPGTQVVFAEEIVAIFEGRTRLRAEVPLRTLAGEELRAAFTITLPADDPELRSVLVSIMDVTERTRAAEAIERQRQDLEALITQSPVPICVVRGPQLVFEMANAAYVRVVGGREIVGKPIGEALPELGSQGFDQVLRDVMRTGEPAVGKNALLMLERDGRLHETYWTFIYSPLRDPDGTIDRVVALCSEVTEEKRLLDELQEANRVKSEFLANMSHELRTPLNAIAGHAQLIEMGVHGPVTAAQREALARIRRSQQHLLSLINDVLNFARLEAGRVEYHVEDVPLGDAVADVLPMVEPELVGKGLAVAVDVPAEVRARADREKLRQVLLNLLSNAVKFTPAGGRVRVDTPTRAEGEMPAEVVFLRVADTGIGIPADKLEVIFDPFVQVHRNLTRATEGAGLGLAISRDLARGMGGELRARSVEGEGSAFTLTLRAVGG
jgi:PAS domain S-box-containing protein